MLETTAGFVAGGDTSASSSGQVNNTETYNGTSFTEANNIMECWFWRWTYSWISNIWNTGPGSPNYVNNSRNKHNKNTSRCFRNGKQDHKLQLTTRIRR